MCGLAGVYHLDGRPPEEACSAVSATPCGIEALTMKACSCTRASAWCTDG